MTKKKKVSKASKRRLLFFGVPSVVIIVYCLFSAGYYVYKINSLKYEEKGLTDKLFKLQKEEKILSNDMEKLKDPDYLAKYAREIYSYSKDDEIIIQEYEEEEVEEEKPKFQFSENDKNILIICTGIIVFIIFYIIIRSRKKR